MAPEYPMDEPRMFDASAPYQNADSMSRGTVRSGMDSPVHPARSGPSPPVFDAVMVGREAMADAPQNRLGAAGYGDLAIDRSDIGLHRVRTQVGERCHLGVAMALGDQRQDLRFAVCKPLAAAWPIQSAAAAWPKGWVADHDVACVDRLKGGDEVARPGD